MSACVPCAALNHLSCRLASAPNAISYFISYFKILIARAITSAPMRKHTTASVIIRSLAQCLIAETSVVLNAAAVQKASDR